MSVEFLLTSFIVIVSPGTGVLYTLAAGLSRGSRASVVAAFGCTIGIVPHMAAAIMGLAALLHTGALAFQTFKYLGVAYLLYMAWNTLRERGALKVEQEVGARSAIQVTVTGILINILNPKLSIFFLAFLPQFVSAGEPNPLSRMLVLSGIFHGDDLRGLRRLRAVRRLDPRPRDLASARADLDAPELRLRVRRAGRAARVDRSLRPTRVYSASIPAAAISFRFASRSAWINAANAAGVLPTPL